MRKSVIFLIALLLTPALAARQRVTTSTGRAPVINRFVIPHAYGTCPTCESIDRSIPVFYASASGATGQPDIQRVAFQIIYADLVAMMPPTALQWQEFPSTNSCNIGPWNCDRNYDQNVYSRNLYDSLEGVVRARGMITTYDGTHPTIFVWWLP